MLVGLSTSLTDKLSIEANYVPFAQATWQTKAKDADAAGNEYKSTNLGGGVQVRAIYNIAQF